MKDQAGLAEELRNLESARTSYFAHRQQLELMKRKDNNDEEGSRREEVLASSIDDATPSLKQKDVDESQPHDEKAENRAVKSGSNLHTAENTGAKW